jgi:hypothetical protein
VNQQEARKIQRIYQRRGWYTFTSTVIYSGREAEGLHWIVWVVDDKGKEHSMYEAHERIGMTRTIVI